MVEPPIRKSQQLHLDSLTDLIRLTVSSMDRAARGGYMYYCKHNGEDIYLLNQIVPGWYDFRGLPITLVAKSDREPEGKFVAYRFGTDTIEESWEFVDQIQPSPNVALIPIIKVKQLPDFIL
ncbi:MAG: hypothetical protein ACXAC2_20240 [Candidatus Kariarchaeaceae archaeon]|jgi:hypothetical protein